VQPLLIALMCHESCRNNIVACMRIEYYLTSSCVNWALYGMSGPVRFTRVLNAHEVSQSL
jgi:hypothetical protein